ncbi:hypothetical protein K438DRAFT_1754505 [Mycena galopus ATCC 62051]|nr:hypothetical protein K438DRAFT_1754505 [Mycena galopus ATCC 62051]
MRFAVRCGGLLNSDTFIAGDPWTHQHPPSTSRNILQTLLLLAILGFRVFGAVLASPGFVVTLHRHLSDSEVCEAMVFGGLVNSKLDQNAPALSKSVPSSFQTLSARFVPFSFLFISPMSSILLVPQDVVQLPFLKVLSWVIDGLQRNSIWRYAFRNVLLPPTFNRLYLPSRITALVFGGGKCYVCPRSRFSRSRLIVRFQKCGAHTRALPYSFTLQEF